MSMSIFNRYLSKEEAILTLLFFFPAVVSEIGDIVVLHAPLHTFQVGAAVLFRELVVHIVGHP